MKQFVKNNLNIITTIIITTIIVGSVSVYAASQFFAKDITFTPTNENFKKENGEAITNVEDALNILYTNSEKKASLTLKNVFQTRDATYYSRNQVLFNDISLDINKYYKYFKIIQSTPDENASYCKISAYSRKQAKIIQLEVNTEYEVLSSTDDYNFSGIYYDVLAIKSGNLASCTLIVQFYNK